MDPFALSPGLNFALPKRSAGRPRSPSRSPSRRQRFNDIEVNPLLSNLSPSFVLEALQATDAVSTGSRSQLSFIQQSVGSASTSERAWGTKAALAGKKVRDWHAELASWRWPESKGKRNGFEPPPTDESRTGYSHGFHIDALAAATGGHDSKHTSADEYLGSLPTKLVREYEDRLEIIRNGMGALEVEDLKDYVRNTHLKLASRDFSTYETQVLHDYGHMDDFTAVITATIVQSLPIISRLDSLLNVWSGRLVILRLGPAFLADLYAGKESLVSAWIAVDNHGSSLTNRKSAFSRKGFSDIQAILQDQISDLGRRLDTMLDILDGSEDVLPEYWIDGMDKLESEYSEWVVKAEELILNNEMNVVDIAEELPRNDISGFPGSEDRVDIHVLQPELNVEPQLNDIRQEANDDCEERVYSKPKEMLLGNAMDTSASLGSSQQDLSNGARAGTSTDDPLNRHSLDGQSAGLSPTELTPRSNHRPRPLVLKYLRHKAESNISSDAASDTSGPGSATTDYFSNKSSPEVHSAVVAEYLGSPIQVTSTSWTSEQNRSSLDASFRRSSQQIEGFKPVVLEPRMPLAFWPPARKTHVRTRSASVQSFEVIPKHEIRKIMVQRNGSYSSATRGSSNLGLEDDPVHPVTVSASTLSQAETWDGLTAPMPDSATEDAGAPFQASPKPNGGIDGTKLHVSSSSAPPSPTKSIHRFERISDLGPGSTPVTIRQMRTDFASGGDIEALKVAQDPSLSFDDKIEARISSILNEIPTQIRLTTGPEPDSPVVVLSHDPSDPKNPHSRSHALRLTRSRMSTLLPSITLAPAQPKTSKSRPQNGEPEIKLYHLHQSGNAAPIKLFVRLVGETGERVMVRIGGGWADLGEYLREYASHHGRRSVSDSPFDIQGLPSPCPHTSPASRPASPTSSSKTIPAPKFKRHQTSPAVVDRPQTPVSDPYIRTSSRMSWTGVDEDSPSLGLAGPKTRKLDISPRKQAWVDKMLEQVKGKGPDIGEIGLVGGTKRVFLKGRKEG